MRPPTPISYYADRYFTNSRDACALAKHNPCVVYQVFQRHEAVLCGMTYALEALQGAGPGIEIHALKDGDLIAPLEPVMHIRGPVQQLIEYETVYLGLLARMTKVATAVRAAVKAANGKPILFFPARFDVFDVQEYDGYAACIGGAAGASTQAEANAFHRGAIGTIPHALIAAFRGDTVAASLAVAKARPHEPIWTLVDFENDSVETSLAVFHAFRDRGLELAGVRLDTGQDLVDQALARDGGNERGVNVALVWLVRRALDEAGGQEVKIAVSGGFTEEKIRRFEAEHAPVDVYAVGEAFFRGSIPFTSDIVGYYDDGRFVQCGKVGRAYRESPRMQRVR